MLRSQTEYRRVQTLRVDKINPLTFLNFRVEDCEGEDFIGLMDSIRRYGLLQPVIVRRSHIPSNGNDETHAFDLVCGYRRLAALRKLGHNSVDCIVLEVDDKEAFEIALVENVQKKSLDPIEEAEAFKSYVVNFGRGSVTRLAARIGKSEEYVSHRLLLLGLPKSLQDKISRRLLNPSLAMELVWAKEPKKQLVLSELIGKHNLSLRQVRMVMAILRTEDISVEDATSRVLRTRRTGVSHHPSTSDFSTDFAPAKEAQGEEDFERLILSRAVLVMRSTLAGVDFLIQKASRSQAVSELLMDKRQRIHSILDEVISAQVCLKKRGTVTMPMSDN